MRREKPPGRQKGAWLFSMLLAVCLMIAALPLSVSAAGARVDRTPAGTMESAQATRAFSAFISDDRAAISAPCSSTASGSAWYSASRASKVASSSTCQSRRAGRPHRSVAPRASRKALSWAAALASAISLERSAWE